MCVTKAQALRRMPVPVPGALARRACLTSPELHVLPLKGARCNTGPARGPLQAAPLHTAQEVGGACLLYR